MAAWDLVCFQTEVIDYWNNTDWSNYAGITPPRRKCRLRACELPEEIKQQQQEKRQWELEWRQEKQQRREEEQREEQQRGGQQPSFRSEGSLEARSPETSKVEPPRRIRDCLRPRPRKCGPFLPLLSDRHSWTIDLVDLPPYDPAKFDWRAAGASVREKRGKEIDRERAVGAAVGGRRRKKIDRRRAGAKRKVL